jgi:hypothetical protein
MNFLSSTEKSLANKITSLYMYDIMFLKKLKIPELFEKFCVLKEHEWALPRSQKILAGFYS